MNDFRAVNSLRTRDDAERMSGILKLLSHPNRLLIAAALGEREYSVGELEQMIGVAQPTLSRDLARFREAGIVETRRESKTVFYRLAASPAAQLAVAVLGLLDWPHLADSGDSNLRLAVDNERTETFSTSVSNARESAAFAQVSGIRQRKVRLAGVGQEPTNSSR